MKTILENNKLAATWDGYMLRIKVKSSGQVATIDPCRSPEEVTDPRYIAALNKQGKPVSSRRMYGAACIPTEMANEIHAAIIALPEVQAEQADRTRSQLAMDLSCALDADHYAGQQAIEHASEHGRYRTPGKDLAAKAIAAEAALKQFDAEHPEVIARIREDQAAAAERNAWN